MFPLAPTRSALYPPSRLNYRFYSFLFGLLRCAALLWTIFSLPSGFMRAEYGGLFTHLIVSLVQVIMALALILASLLAPFGLGDTLRSTCR